MDLLDGTIYPGERSFVWIVIIGLIVIVLGFRLLNAYVVQGERLFRFHYDKVRQQSDTDFNMYVTEYKNKPKGKFASAFFSFSLRLFYTIELIFALFIPTLFLLSN